MILDDIGFKKVEKYLEELEKSAYISKMGDGYNITEKGSEMLKHKK
jgi:predicted transcriptional regulator